MNIQSKPPRPAVNVEAFKQYDSTRWTLIPLHRPDATSTKRGRSYKDGKRPLHFNWTKQKYVFKDVLKVVTAKGLNAGIRLRKNQLVIDVDPRNGGTEGFMDLCLDLELDTTGWPHVITGRGGSHYYLTKPADWPVVDTLGRYPGVEFKSFGRQVVAAGSVHPETNEYYEFDSEHPSVNEAPEAPTSLLEAIKRPERSAEKIGGGQYDQSLIAEMLATLDPTDFQDHSSWFALMCAVHHASNGDARDEFIEWSCSDSKFAGDAEVIGRRWDSLHADADAERLTYKTLNKILRDKSPDDGANLIPANTVPDDEFPDECDSNIPDARPEPFKFDMTKLSEMLDHSERTMLAAGVPLYQTGGRMVHPVRLDADSDEEQVRRKAGALTVRDISPLRLREYVITHVPFYRVVKSPKTNKPTRLNHAPPLQLANHLLAREDKWQLPVLNGVIEAPTLRRDGSLLTDDGYDKSSGLLLDKGGVTYPTIPDHPTLADAKTALEILKWPLKDFPFVANAKGESASQSVMLSAVLTGLVRRTLHSAPLHGTSAPTMGTGKTLLQDVVSMIATGRLATAMSQGANEEEDEKRLFSVLLQNDLILLIDNVKRPIEGDALCTILTQSSWQSRILGENRKVSVPTNALFLASGNNLTFKGDMTTRALVCRVDAGVERPETRRFDVDLKAEVPRRRPELVTAGLTILRAFVCAGRPGLEKLEPFGRFEEWSNLVRGALVWLGEPDPCKTRAFIATDDPDRNALGELLQAMIDNVEGWKSAGEIISAGNDGSDGMLMDSIDEVAPGGRKQLGHYLKANEGKIVDGLRLMGNYNKNQKTWCYRVVKV